MDPDRLNIRTFCDEGRQSIRKEILYVEREDWAKRLAAHR